DRPARHRFDSRAVGAAAAPRGEKVTAQTAAGRPHSGRSVPRGCRAPDHPENSRIRSRLEAQDGGTAQAFFEDDLQQDQRVRARALTYIRSDIGPEWCTAPEEVWRSIVRAVRSAGGRLRPDRSEGFKNLLDSRILDVDTRGDEPQDDAALERFRRNPLTGGETSGNSPRVSVCLAVGAGCLAFHSASSVVGTASGWDASCRSRVCLYAAVQTGPSGRHRMCSEWRGRRWRRRGVMGTTGGQSDGPQPVFWRRSRPRIPPGWSRSSPRRLFDEDSHSTSLTSRSTTSTFPATASLRWSLGSTTSGR